MNELSRVEKLFKNEKAKIAYLTSGDGGIACTLDAAFALIEGGVNLLEIGVPFSDPVADGPVIQSACERALSQGTTIEDVLWLVKEIRKKSEIPLILFSYLNPILAVDPAQFLKRAKEAGVDGLLLVDCPLEESDEIYEYCITYQLDLIYVITPSTPVSRIKQINQYARGFLYYACRKGTTGVRSDLPDGLKEKIESIKEVSQLPVVVGFGISNYKMVDQIFQFADGAVIGSLFVNALAEKISMQDLTKIAHDIFSNDANLTCNS